MNYLTGEAITRGDRVALEHGRTIGTVEAVIETQAQMAEWGVNAAGVMVAAAPFGLVFWPLRECLDPLVLLSREPISGSEH
ncbi:hypothetical protein [Pseudomonas sp. SO81]|uniref:hypothetical protein n=1 Tax=Pseudomonas sp. SO81 TaxID=2983246 RepID=UPI0025A31378|nr:hypothetical protein [Pseudomonas sp. SO81]WJN57279.1 hypothetical protein OH686_00940 [Pseudomonas sp. SO81]